MIKRLIRWLARAEIDAADAATKAVVEMNAALIRQRDHDYANGYNAGRAVGHSEMLTHLRGDPDERVTAEIMQRRAAEMVH